MSPQPLVVEREGSDWRIRRPHRKTRTGCNQCKRRRVKCDERKPICTSCERNKLQCGLAFLTPSRVSMRPAALQTRTSTPRPPPTTNKSLNPPTKKNTKTTPAATTSGPPCLNIRFGDMDLRSAEILHHYQTVVSFMITGPKVVHVWQTTIPHMALEHKFLMHGILALSALNLSVLIPARKDELVTFAMISEQLALPPFRSYLADDQKKGNLHAVFAFSHFVVPYMLNMSGSLEGPMGKVPSYEGQPHWFHALRGYMAFLYNNWDALVTGPLGYQMVKSPITPDNKRDHPEDVHLAKIHEILKPGPELTARDKWELEVCGTALEELRQLWSGPYMLGKMGIVGMIYLWPSKVSKEYISLMHKRRPEALVILAHYALLVKRMNMLWYLRGVGAKLLVAINDELAEQYKPYVEWAMNEPVE
ncbi:Sterol uptake control protein 2 [Lachnellula cervina]|uniref:Sterol uptake control protein 2 n=1 Tax=Lachnellula cervina TaxID=1316786 RepID=A0A7D8UL92_9HELO|nr:Sterol uptake control protein 2 [Lachnellula cervina]